MKMLMLCVHDRVTVGEKGDEYVFLGMKESVLGKYKMSLSHNMQLLGRQSCNNVCSRVGMSPHRLGLACRQPARLPHVVNLAITARKRDRERRHVILRVSMRLHGHWSTEITFLLVPFHFYYSGLTSE